MINDLTTTRTKPWKYVDDTTLSEVIHKGKSSSIQEPVDEVQEWTRSNLAELNEDKCKELRIDFSRKQTQTNHLNPIRVNGKDIEVVNNAKILGLTDSSDCKWKMHVDNIVSKASKRLYLQGRREWGCVTPPLKTSCRQMKGFVCKQKIIYHKTLS
jgi:hypothetical protein